MILVFKEKLPTTNRDAIIQKINSVSASLGVDPNWLMAVMNFETAGTFSPSIQNKTTKATGLIQFMPTTAQGLGTTVEALKNMDFIRQMDFVEKYYRPLKSKIKGFVDLYLATFFPIAIGKPEDWVLQTGGISAAKIAEQNPVFDQGGFVTVGKIKQVILSRIPAQYLDHVVKQNIGLVGIATAFFLGWLLFKQIRKKK